MKTMSKNNSSINYDEVVHLACQLWQSEGCQFGHYYACWQQAKHRLVGGRRSQARPAGRALRGESA